MEYKSNSHKAKEQKQQKQENIPAKKVEKVASGKVRKKSEVRKFADVFLAEDLDSVKSYILIDVLIPTIKKAISDIVTNGIDMLLGMDSLPKNKRSTSSKVSYRKYYDDSHDRRDRPLVRTRTRYNYDDVEFENRGEAEEVLMRLRELLEMYEVVSVADLYDLADVEGDYTDYKYGWTQLDFAEPVRLAGGMYRLKLPRVKPI